MRMQPEVRIAVAAHSGTVRPSTPKAAGPRRAALSPRSAVVLLLATGLLLGPMPALAATLCVDNTNACSDGTGAPCYCTIGAAVTAAVSGVDTVSVLPGGTYPETVVLAKNLVLQGGQAGTGGCDRSATESVIAPAPGARGIELQAGSAGSTIEGFTISGGSRGIESTSGPINDVTIRNNRIVAFTGNGIFLNDPGTDVTVDGNLVDGSSKIGSGNLVHLDTDGFNGFRLTDNCIQNGLTATGFFVDGNHNVNPSAARVPAITGNFISRNLTGVNLGSRAFGGSLAAGNAVISGNTFTRNTFDGLQGGMQRTAITGNVLSQNGRHGLSLTSFGNAAADRGAQNDVVTENCVLDNGRGSACGSGGPNTSQPCTDNAQCPSATCNALLGSGIFFSATQAAGTISTNVANANNLSGNQAGATYTGAEIIDGTGNWWGCPTGPNSAGCDSASANVTTAPFLNDPEPAAPCSDVTQCSLGNWEVVNFDASLGIDIGDTPTASGTDGTFVTGPGTPPLGTGSFGEVVGTDGDDATRIRTTDCNGLLLSDVASSPLSYWTYVTSFGSGGQATYVQLRIDLDNDGSTDDVLFFEPVYQNGTYSILGYSGAVPNQCPGFPPCVQLGAWQYWDARVGGWWSANDSAGGPPLTTLQGYAANYPGARIATDTPSLRLTAGFGAGAWDGFDGATDALTACGTTYDFENGPCPTPTPIPTPTPTPTPTPMPTTGICHHNCPDIIRLRPGIDQLQVKSGFAPGTILDPANESFRIVLRNANGIVYQATLQPGDLVPRGKAFVFKDNGARRGLGTRGGLAKVQISPVTGGTGIRVNVQAFGDLSAATLAVMTVEIAVGTDAIAYTAPWQQRPYGWTLLHR